MTLISIKQSGRRGISLPYPPSLNGIFSRFKGSHMSESYRQWRDEAGWALKEQSPTKLSGPVAIFSVSE